MSLLSLLIALMAEKSLSSSLWRFDHYYQKYIHYFQNNTFLSKHNNSSLASLLFLLIPVAVVYLVMQLIDDGLLHLIISTAILIVCFGCCATRKYYKSYLHASFQGESTTAELYHQQLLQDKNIPEMSFGQALIWLNYRYYIAVMIFFVLFGATGVVFYRLLTTIIEQQPSKDSPSINETDNPCTEKSTQTNQSFDCRNYHQILFLLDWLLVRIISFGYMFVGHFSKAFPMWIESLFDFNKPTYKILIDVAQKSEDIMIDKDDCSAEPCLLVRLAKRNLLLVLSVISILTLMGIVN